MASSGEFNAFHIQSLLSEQIPFLNLFFPGLAPVISSLWALFTVIPNGYSGLLCGYGMLLVFGKYISQYVISLLEAHFTTTINVPHRDEAYDMLILWVCAQPFAQSARTSLVIVDLKPTTSGDGPIEKKPLQFSPCNGRSYFWHKRNLFIFTRTRSQEKYGFIREKVSLSYFGRNPDVLKDLLRECRHRWKPSRLKSKRDAATVIINENLKNMLIDDVDEFLASETRSWYYEHDLPYQRGYLFHGPPGTGKSSLSLSVAGRFDLDLYVLSIPGLNDRSLKNLFDEFPHQCVVLLEDVDAIGLDRSQGVCVVTETSSDARPRKSAGKVSLSILFNVLDGTGLSEGRVLVMTTNHIDYLDPALIRPGRADVRVEFRLADRDIICQLFLFIYSSKPSNLVEHNGSKKSADKDGKDNVTQNCELHQLAKELAAKIPKFEFSPAEIMCFLLANKHLPRRAVADVDAWMEQSREERKKLSRTNSWALNDEDEVEIH